MYKDTSENHTYALLFNSCLKGGNSIAASSNFQYFHYKRSAAQSRNNVSSTGLHNKY